MTPTTSTILADVEYSIGSEPDIYSIIVKVSNTEGEVSDAMLEAAARQRLYLEGIIDEDTVVRLTVKSRQMLKDDGSRLRRTWQELRSFIERCDMFAFQLGEANFHLVARDNGEMTVYITNQDGSVQAEARLKDLAILAAMTPAPSPEQAEVGLLLDFERQRLHLRAEGEGHAEATKLALLTMLHNYASTLSGAQQASFHQEITALDADNQEAVLKLARRLAHSIMLSLEDS